MFGLTRIQQIPAADLPQRLREPHAMLIDVREPSEYRAGHIHNARNVPFARIDQFTPPTDAHVYVICHSGARSKRAYKRLAKRGFDVFNVRGGMLAWKGALV